MTYIKKRLNILFSLCLSLTLVLAPMAVRAQNDFAPVVIRDTEMEDTFREWIGPLLKASGLGPSSINLIIVQSPDVNAFVAGGANIFVYTGLIEKTENPGEVIGVLAHELGHVAGGHMVSTRDALQRASYESILGAVLGAGIAIATGNGGAGSAIVSGSSNVAQRRFLTHSRVNEASADQAALRFLENARMNPAGLGSFLEKLESNDLLPSDQQSEYVRTHPLTRNRIEAVENRAAKSPYAQTAFPAEWVEQHKRMKAKLLGYISPGSVAWTYDDRDDTTAALYARAVAAYRQNDTGKALGGIDALITREPENPYFQELKGQMLRDFGRVKESLPYYQKATRLKPHSGLIRIDYAHALIESGGGQKALDEAIPHLERALRDEPRSTRAHRLLATAYGRSGQEGKAKLHLAEEATLQRKLPYAKAQAESALKTFKSGSPDWIKARDLLNHIENLETLEN